MRRNPFLIERLKEDASGIVNWALAARQGPDRPQCRGPERVNWWWGGLLRAHRMGDQEGKVLPGGRDPARRQEGAAPRVSLRGLYHLCRC